MYVYKYYINSVWYLSICPLRWNIALWSGNPRHTQDWRQKLPSSLNSFAIGMLPLVLNLITNPYKKYSFIMVFICTSTKMEYGTRFFFSNFTPCKVIKPQDSKLLSVKNRRKRQTLFKVEFKFRFPHIHETRNKNCLSPFGLSPLETPQVPDINPISP